MITCSIARAMSVMSAILFKSGMNIRNDRCSCSFIGLLGHALFGA